MALWATLGNESRMTFNGVGTGYPQRGSGSLDRGFQLERLYRLRKNSTSRAL